MIENLPKVGDWINYKEKAYKVLEVSVHPTGGFVWLYVSDMLDREMWLTMHYDVHAEKPTLPLVIFSEAMTK